MDSYCFSKVQCLASHSKKLQLSTQYTVERLYSGSNTVVSGQQQACNHILVQVKGEHFTEDANLCEWWEPRLSVAPLRFTEVPETIDVGQA